MPTFGNNFYLVQSKTRGGAVPGAPAGNWTPASLGSTLKGWWDTSGLAYNTTNSYGVCVSANVNQVSDLSGNANHAILGSAPSLQAADQNGLSTVFGSGTQYLELTSNIDCSANGWTIWAIMKRTSASNVVSVACNNTVPTTSNTVELYSDGHFYLFDNSKYYGSSLATYTDTASYHCVVGTVDKSATPSNMKLYYDSASVDACNSSGAQTSSWTINRIYYGSGGGINGYIGEVGICDTVLSSGDMTSLRSYLKTKWATA